MDGGQRNPCSVWFLTWWVGICDISGKHENQDYGDACVGCLRGYLLIINANNYVHLTFNCLFAYVFFLSLTINANQIVVALLCALRIFTLICLSQPCGIRMHF